jgi:predicted dehydrogenase
MTLKNDSVLIIGTGEQASKYYNILKDQLQVTFCSATNRRSVHHQAAHISFNEIASFSYKYIIITGSEKNRLESLKNAIKASDNILIEKPAALTISDYQYMIELSKNSNVRMAFNRRFFHQFSNLEPFLSTSNLIGGVVLDQQSVHAFSKRRLSQFDSKLVLANSIHSIDLINYIIGINGDNLSHNSNIVSNNQSLSANINSSYEKQFRYFCSKSGPGPWSLYFYYDNYILHFPNHEEYMLKDHNRKCVLQSTFQKSSTGDDLIGLWKAFVTGKSSVPTLQESLAIHQLCLELDNG